MVADVFAVSGKGNGFSTRRDAVEGSKICWTCAPLCGFFFARELKSAESILCSILPITLREEKPHQIVRRLLLPHLSV